MPPYNFFRQTLCLLLSCAAEFEFLVPDTLIEWSAAAKKRPRDTPWHTRITHFFRFLLFEV